MRTGHIQARNTGHLQYILICTHCSQFNFSFLYVWLNDSLFRDTNPLEDALRRTEKYLQEANERCRILEVRQADAEKNKVCSPFLLALLRL